MPMLYDLGQHGALLCLQDFLLPHEHLFAFLDDLYVVCLPDRVGPILKHLQEALDQYARIQVHLGKTQVWNRGGHLPPGCQEMQEVAARVDPQARVWRGEGPPSQQGVRVLGIPIGHEEFRPSFGPPPKSTDFWLKRILWCRISKVLGCSSSSAPTLARRIPSAEFRQLRQSSLQPLTIQPRGSVSPSFWESLVMQRRAYEWASLPFQMGGCGLRSAPERVSQYIGPAEPTASG